MSSQLLTKQEIAQPVIEELVADSSVLILVFGGRKGAMGMPTFEFYQSTAILNENRVFFRDLSQSWYHAGLTGITQDIHQTKDYIQTIINRIKPSEIIFVGNSMGGFAAILFSTLLNTGRVVAFSPQTYIGLGKKLKEKDLRWKYTSLRTYARSFFKPKYYDLRSLLQESKRQNKIDIHISTLEKLDVMHSRNINEFSNVTVHEYDFGGHSLVKNLRDKGMLKDILMQSYSQASNQVT